MIVLEDLIRDRGSRYAAAAGSVRSKAEIEAFLTMLRRRRKFDKKYPRIYRTPAEKEASYAVLNPNTWR